MTEARPAPFVSAPPKRVVFVCIHNSARSQIAEGFARALAPAGTEVWSAGTEPGRVHPAAIDVMKEAGIDISAHRSKSLDEVPWRDADTVVTLCGDPNEVCPAVAASVRKLHWGLPDPSAAAEDVQLQTFRQVRDEIRWRVSALWPRTR